MITGGVSFQPGMQAQQPGQRGSGSPASNPVQEAIKVLSLRLPKVVGARGIAPTPLLTSEGSGGNSRVDSVVNQVLARMFGDDPGAAAAPSPSFGSEPSQAPSMPNAPSFGGDVQSGFRPQREQTSVDRVPDDLWRRIPNIIIGDLPPAHSGDLMTGADGRPMGGGGGVFGSLPGTDANQPPAAVAPAPQWPPYGLPSSPEPAFESNSYL